MAQLTYFQDSIDEIDAEISTYNAEIANIDAETPSDQDIIDMLAARKAELESRVTELTTRKTEFQNYIDSINTADARTFDTGQQTTVDTISSQFSGQYDDQMEELRKMDSSKKTEFFDLYAKAENAVQEECTIRNFFNL